VYYSIVYSTAQHSTAQPPARVPAVCWTRSAVSACQCLSVLTCDPVCLCLSEYTAGVDVPAAPAPAGGSVSVSVTQLYWLVAWAEVDPRWGQAPSAVSSRQGQGQGQGQPQSYLAKARTAPGFRRAQSRADMGPLAPAARLPRAVQGRAYWPSDPAVVSVTRTYHASGSAASAPTGATSAVGSSSREPDAVEVRVVSEVHNCAWWTRGRGD
jgi:hypothetical protein